MKVIQHGGAVFGVLTMVVLVPDHKLGFSLQINSEDVDVMRGLMYELLDHYLASPQRPLPEKDWVAAFAKWNSGRIDAGTAALDASAGGERRRTKPSLPSTGYAGAYTDPWYGPIAITEQGGKLRIDFRQSPGMVGTLNHRQYDTFQADWDDGAIEPSYVTFALDAEGKVSRITMKALSPIADFSYDYQDLLFTPAQAMSP